MSEESKIEAFRRKRAERQKSLVSAKQITLPQKQMNKDIIDDKSNNKITLKVSEASPEKHHLFDTVRFGQYVDTFQTEKIGFFSNKSTLISLVLFVVLPYIISILYISFYASPQYYSEFHFSVQGQEATPTATSGTSSSQDLSVNKYAPFLQSYVVIDYIKSAQSLRDVQKYYDLLKIFSNSSIDYVSRLASDAPTEKMLYYWQSHIETYFDMTTGLAIVKIRAFSPTEANQLARKLLELSENLINDMSQRPRLDYLSYAQKMLEEAGERLNSSRNKVKDIRSNQLSVDPGLDANIASGLAGKLNEQIALLKAQLAVLRQQLSSTSPSVIQVEAQIKSLTEQVIQIKSLVGDKPKIQSQNSSQSIEDRKYAEQMLEYQAAQTEFELALQNYSATYQTVDAARRSVGSQHSYVLASVWPTTAQMSEFPTVLKSGSTILAVLFSVWCIGVLLFYSLRERI